MTPLLLAIGSAHFETAALLLDRGANPNVAPLGWAPIHQISWIRKAGQAGSNNPAPQGSGVIGSLEFTRKLIATGADINAQVTRRPPVGVSDLNMRGATAFLLAARTADADLMKLLVEFGADPTIPNDDDSTPLMVAAGLGTGAPGEDPGTGRGGPGGSAICLKFGRRHLMLSITWATPQCMAPLTSIYQLWLRF